MARSTDKPYTPRFSTDFNSTLQQLKALVASTKDMPVEDRSNAITKALKQLAPEFSKIGIMASDTVDYKHIAPHTTSASTTFIYQGSSRDFARAKVAMERIADTTALALLGTQHEDAITRYPLNPNAVNALNSSSLLVVQNKSGAITGIYHVSGDQLSGELEYKTLTVSAANQLLDEAIQSAQVRDGLNASTPGHASQAPKYQSLKNSFAQATAEYTDAAVVSSTASPEPQAPLNTARPAWAQYYDTLQNRAPASAAYKAAYENYWNRVVNNAVEFIGGDTWVRHEQPVLLDAVKGTKDWQQYLFLIEQNGIPKLFLAAADLEKRAIFTEIDAARAIELATAGYDGDTATKAAQKFTDTLKRYEYPLPESLVFTTMSDRSNAKSASPGNRQSGFAYAASDWLVESFSNSDKSPANSALNRLQNTILENPAWAKSAAKIALLPALYTIAEETRAAYISSGMQSAMNTASQELARLYASVEAGVAASPYTLPLLATPQGEIAYMASTMVATMAGSQTMEALEKGTMYLWQKLAVEPLQAQADEREQLKQQEQSARNQHQDIVNSIPDDSSQNRSPVTIPITASAQTLLQTIEVNATKNGWSTEKTDAMLQAIVTNDSKTSPDHPQQPLLSTQAVGHDITGP